MKKTITGIKDNWLSYLVELVVIGGAIWSAINCGKVHNWAEMAWSIATIPMLIILFSMMRDIMGFGK